VNLLFENTLDYLILGNIIHMEREIYFHCDIDHLSKRILNYDHSNNLIKQANIYDYSLE